MKATRVFQLTALALVVVSAVQVGWWLFDQHAYTLEKVRAARGAYAEQTAAAQALIDSGMSAQRVQQLLPATVVNDGRAALAPQVEQALTTEARHRYNQYAWEGAFFLLALALCIAVIARALRAEAHAREICQHAIHQRARRFSRRGAQRQRLQRQLQAGERSLELMRHQREEAVLLLVGVRLGAQRARDHRDA